MDKIRTTDITGKKLDKPAEGLRDEQFKYDLPGVYTEVTEERKSKVKNNK